MREVINGLNGFEDVDAFIENIEVSSISSYLCNITQTRYDIEKEINEMLTIVNNSAKSIKAMIADKCLDKDILDSIRKRDKVLKYIDELDHKLYLCDLFIDKLVMKRKGI